MPKGKHQTVFVIFAAPEVRGGPGTWFIGRDGQHTQSRNAAAKFHTWESARAFAAEKGISLEGALPYIGRHEFREEEMRE